jgi:hypothetical protein
MTFRKFIIRDPSDLPVARRRVIPTDGRSGVPLKLLIWAEAIKPAFKA